MGINYTCDRCHKLVDPMLLNPVDMGRSMGNVKWENNYLLCYVCAKAVEDFIKGGVKKGKNEQATNTAS